MAIATNSREKYRRGLPENRVRAYCRLSRVLLVATLLETIASMDLVYEHRVRMAAASYTGVPRPAWTAPRILSQPRDQHFDGWPATTSRPLCPEVYFNEGSVPLEAIQKFAEAWDAPSVIRQRFSNSAHLDIEGPEEPEWDCWRVEGDVGSDGRFVEGTQRVTLGLEYEGAIFSWEAELADGRMNDWRRLVTRNNMILLQHD